MNKTTGYQFSEREKNVLKDALAMYASYMKEMEAPMLVGDESDAGKIMRDTNTAESMFREFFEEVEGQTPMYLSDESKFDWFEYRQ